MLAVRIYILISLMRCISTIPDTTPEIALSTINNTMPEIPSYFIPHTELLPERSESTKTQFSFQKYIPVACFCDRSKCNANIPPIEAPVIGLFTRDGKIVKSLDVQVDKGELMFILLIDSQSSLAGDTYLEHTSYWHLIDSQHQLLAGVSLDFEIRRQVSTAILKENSLQFPYGNETKRTAINALELSTGLSILIPEELESKTNYHYSASQFSQVAGVYQLFHELTIHAGVALTDYTTGQKTGARCSLYFIMREPCGSLQLLPSFLRRTPVFRQVAVVDDPTTATGSNPISKKRELSGKAKATIISLSIVGILLVVFGIAIWYYHKRCRYPWRRQPPVKAQMLAVYLDDNDDDQGL